VGTVAGEEFGEGAAESSLAPFCGVVVAGTEASAIEGVCSSDCNSGSSDLIVGAEGSGSATAFPRPRPPRGVRAPRAAFGGIIGAA
jgi:hypothetical protein